jgi:predicted AAA+ superfamily ATPase
MNDFHSGTELGYLPRWITPRLQAASREHRIVVLTGARQVGKSTLLRQAAPFAQWKYYTFDDYDVLRQAESDPKALWAGAGDVVLDEVQKSPAVVLAVKQAVDSNREPPRFVLSGSANLLLMRQVSESLAGRAVYFVLAPMTLGEVNRQPAPTMLVDLLAGKFPAEGTVPRRDADLSLLLLRGWMPALLRLSGPAAWVEWWEGYVATYLERDLRQISQIDSLSDFRRVMEFLALRTGQLLNQSEIARDAKISQPTIHRYINLLEATHLLQRLPAFTTSRTTRLLKTPKVHWADSGLVIFLAGYFDAASLSAARELGGFFETFVLQHLQVLAELLTPRGRLYFWRTRAGQEVDLVVEQGQRLVAFEIKMSETVKFADADGLRFFLKEHPKAVGGVVIYRGQEIRQLDERVVALPLSIVLGF